MSLRCNVCRKEYSYGRKISLDCCGEERNFGAIFENETNFSAWNCKSINNVNQKRQCKGKSDMNIHFLKTGKNYALIYE
ncbi:MAG: hypothetical protein ACFFA6_12525 [Promethearchaeota archaeon]